MSRDDWIGLGASLGVHLLLLGAFALTVAGHTPPQALGAVQVQLGTFAEGQPVQQQAAPANDESLEPKEEPEKENEASSAASRAPETPPAQKSAPPDLPEQQQPPKGKDPPPQEKPPENEESPPAAEPSETESEKAKETSETAPPRENAPSDTRPPAKGGVNASADTGAPEETEGAGDGQQQAAPYNIEGLNRTRLRGALPQYTDKVNAVIKVKITVDPQGRVVGRRLLRKANPSLERSVLEALRHWHFDPLPRNAPQENQTGVVTFRFRLE